MLVIMGMERIMELEEMEDEEVGLERMRLKRCHANVGLLVFLIRALTSLFL